MDCSSEGRGRLTFQYDGANANRYGLEIYNEILPKPPSPILKRWVPRHTISSQQIYTSERLDSSEREIGSGLFRHAPPCPAQIEGYESRY